MANCERTRPNGLLDRGVDRARLLFQVSSARSPTTAPLPEHMKDTFDTFGWTEDLAADDPFEDYH